MIKIVGIGGTTKPNSSTEIALRVALASAEAAGAKVELFDGAALANLPHYGTPQGHDSQVARSFVSALRAADGVIIASPGYHGSVSGLVKNAIDYLEDTAGDDRVYLDGVPIGLISTAYGWQATVSTLAALRSIAHALRGWPTPLGATIRSGGDAFVEGRCVDESARAQLVMVGQQVADFARLRTKPPGMAEASA